MGYEVRGDELEGTKKVEERQVSGGGLRLEPPSWSLQGPVVVVVVVVGGCGAPSCGTTRLAGCGKGIRRKWRGGQGGLDPKP